MSTGRRHKDYLLRARRMGGSTTVPADRAREVILDLHQRMSYSAMGKALGTSHTYVASIARGKIQRIAPAREAAILAIQSHRPTDTSHVASHSATRRLRALHALGWTWVAIAADADLSLSLIKTTARGEWAVIEARHDHAIRAAYDRLSMRLPVAEDRYQRSAIGAARNSARRKGWPPPLAWDDIDTDPDPTGWEYVPATRAEQLRDLHERGDSITTACQQLKVGRRTLEKWCERNGMSAIYADLVRREQAGQVRNNQHTAGRVA